MLSVVVFSIGGFAAGLVAIAVAVLGVLREKFNATELEKARQAQLTAVGLVDAEKLKAALWEQFQRELDILRRRDAEQQKIIEAQAGIIASFQLQLASARKEIDTARKERQLLKNERQIMQAKLTSYEAELAELRRKVGINE